MSTPYAYIEISSYLGESERQTIENLINAASPASPHPAIFHGNMTCWFDFESHITLSGGDLVERTKPLITASLWDDLNVPAYGSRPTTQPDLVLTAEYHEVLWSYEWELSVRIEYLTSGQCGTLATVVKQGQLALCNAPPDPRKESSPRGRSATVEIRGPNEWDPAHYYASHYVDVTEIVDLAQTEMWQVTASYSRELLNTHWYYPIQLLARRELACVDFGSDEREYETWYCLARGWRRDQIEITPQLPSYEPHVLLCSQYEEFETDVGESDVRLCHRLYIRADLLQQPETIFLRNASMKRRLSQEAPDERS